VQSSEAATKQSNLAEGESASLPRWRQHGAEAREQKPEASRSKSRKQKVEIGVEGNPPAWAGGYELPLGQLIGLLMQVMFVGEQFTCN
jgi:hypothetical protein